MNKDFFRDEQDDIRDLLRRYENLKTGRAQGILYEDAFERIIDYYDEQDDFEKAMEAVDVGLEQYPCSSTLIIKKADLLIAGRQYKEALEYLDRASLFDYHDIDLYILRTDAYLALDQQEKAVELLQEAIELFDGEERINLLFELSDVYDDYEEFDKIFDCLKLILEYDPNNEEALYKICFWTDFTGRYEQSIRIHQTIIDEYPYNELAWFNLAAAFQGLKLYEKSIDAYKYAIVINEKFDYAYRNMADAFIRIRKYKDAIEALEKVVELARPEDVIYEAIGHCYDKIANYAQARFYYRKASHLNQDDAKLYYKVALTYMNESQWKKAVKYLETALRISPGNREFNLAVGDCYKNLEDIDLAIEYYTKVVNAKPKSISGWESFIRCLYEVGYIEEAFKKIELAEQLAGKKAIFRYYKAAVLFTLGMNKEALIQLQIALNESPGMVKKFISLAPTHLQHPGVSELLAQSKRKK
ncbi:MAG: tetratricopeptide repeat protein [Sphingobacteriales bacterium]|jgi:tetratricopeptide (TPR) repeat protein